MKTTRLPSPYKRSIRPGSLSARIALPILCVAGSLTRARDYRGIGRLTSLLGKILPPATSQIDLSPNTTIQLDLFDYYWVRLIFDDFFYEPEIEAFVLDFSDQNFTWLDCGANIGYWSLRLSERLPPNHVIAIEASPQTFNRLQINNRKSGNRVVTYNNAISDQAGKSLPFIVSGGHAAAHIATREELQFAQSSLVNVETTTIDHIVELHPTISNKLPLLIKLDVEGAEVSAVVGADRTINEYDVVFIYECHGQDRQCVATRHLLNDGRFDIYSLGEKLTKLNSPDEALALKIDLRKGYNFIAVKKSYVLPHAR